MKYDVIVNVGCVYEWRRYLMNKGFHENRLTCFYRKC